MCRRSLPPPTCGARLARPRLLGQNRDPIDTRAATVSPIRTSLSLALLTAAIAASAQAPETAAAKPKSMQDLLDGSKPGDWRALDPARTLYMDLAGGRVVIELAPEFAPAHVANIRAMAKGGYWNGLSINRSQDNFVVQWGDPAEDETARKPLPKATKAKLPAEFTRSLKSMPFTRLPDVDGWAPEVGFSNGFPIGVDRSDGGSAWLAHCYGMVGAGRDIAADSSTGAELYVVTGQSPRQLDRNITTVGFYEKPEQRVAIRSIRLAADLKPAERIKLQVLRTDTPLFAAIVEARRNRRDDFYKRPAGHIDLCNVPLPVRVQSKK
jgi:cyclophilin family peptidyl-prolyl cis-trans isomerase